MSFPRYPECKDSGVEWLGQVPVHWYIKTLKYVATYNDEVLPESTSKDYPIKYVEISDVDEQLGITKWTEYPFASAPSRARRILKDGDVLISTVRTYLRAIAPVTEPPDGLVGSTGFAVIRPVPGIYYSGLLGYVIRAEWFISNIISRSVGVSYPAINASDLVALSLPVPPWKEQKTIAHFLDHETAKIDTLIHEQKRLIELLKEKRQAVISHAVTKGLDPDVPMKDSGVKWLGEVPAHWQLKRLKQVTSQIIDGAHFTPTYVDTGIPFIRVKDIQSTKINMEEIKRIPEDEHAELIKRCHPAKGDILLSKNGTIGLTKIVDWDFQFSIFVSLCLIKSTSEISSEFLEKVLSSNFASEQFRDLGQKTSVTNLHLEKIREMIVLLPTIAEQSRICSFVDLETAKLALLSTEALEGIALLKERRSALISAAVTGKIDVRNWQPPADESAFDEKVSQAGMEAEA